MKIYFSFYLKRVSLGNTEWVFFSQCDKPYLLIGMFKPLLFHLIIIYYYLVFQPFLNFLYLGSNELSRMSLFQLCLLQLVHLCFPGGASRKRADGWRSQGGLPGGGEP